MVSASKSRFSACGLRNYAYALALHADGKIVAAGKCQTSNDWPPSTRIWAFCLARYHPDGNLDPAFDGKGIVTTPIGPRDD
jgi:hypothetical protein